MICFRTRRARRSRLCKGSKNIIFIILLLSLCAFSVYLSLSQTASASALIQIRRNDCKLFLDNGESTPTALNKSNCCCTCSQDDNSISKGNSTPCAINIERLLFDPSNTSGRTHFPLIMPHIEPEISCEDRKLFIAVVVNSDASDEKHRVLRMAIRKTWGNSTETQTKYKWRLFFALGISTKNNYNLKNKQEAFQYNDMIIGNFTDIYKNIVIKTFMSHFWVFNKLPCCEYVLKTDDDVYVRVPRLLKWLERESFPKPFYGGYLNQFPVVFRNPQSQWYVSKEEFNETKWPPFSHGAFQVLSTTILPHYFNYTQFRKPFRTDDAYFGVIARDLNITATMIPGFSLTPPKTDCQHMTATAFGHMLDSPAMLKFHARYKDLV